MNILAITIGFFLLCFIGLIIWVGVKFFYSLFMMGQSNSSYNEETDNEIKKNSMEDSEADLAMTTDDEDSWMFPPEFD